MNNVFNIAKEIVSSSQFWGSFIGIILAAVIGYYFWLIQYRKQVKKDIELKFSNRLNGFITELINATFTASRDYYRIIGRVRYHSENDDKFKLNVFDEQKRMIENLNEFGSKCSSFFVEIEGNELIIGEFIHYRKFLTFVTDDLNRVSYSFIMNLSNPELDILSPKGKIELENKANEIRDKYLMIVCYLHDYRSELMDYFMSGLFKRKMPERVPIDPVFKSLKEVATKESVLEEEKLRNEALKFALKDRKKL